MEIRFVECGNGFNWGKFAVGRFDAGEWRYPVCGAGQPPAELAPGASVPSLLRSQGWSPVSHAWVLDLATGEGAYFTLGGLAAADLQRHQIWVCLLYEPFLDWLNRHYRDHPGDWFDTLPAVLDLPDAPNGLYGHRRPGPNRRPATGPTLARRFGPRWTATLTRPRPARVRA